MRAEFVVAYAGAIAVAVAIGACATDDVDVDPPSTTQNNNTNNNSPGPGLYPIVDEAFAEYLIFRQIPGVVQNNPGSPTRYSVDVEQVATVTELSLSKTNAAMEALQMAGVTTATTKIANLDGLQHFVNIETLTITSNDVRRLDTSALSKLSVLEMNFNLVGELDLTQNPDLVRLRYRASASALQTQRLTQVDVSANTALTHLFLPGHDLRAIDLSANTQLNDTLDLSDNPGPDDDRATPDIVVPAMIFDQVPAMNRRGVTSDAEAPVQLTLVAQDRSFSENAGMATIVARLNRAAEDPVTLELTLAGSATRGTDYEVDSTTLSIPVGQREATAVLTGIDDMDEETAETVEVAATAIMNAQAGVVNVTVTITDDDSPAMLVLNEVLYDPPAAPDGDANGDGTRDAQQDEFVEIVNVGGAPADLSGYMLFDARGLDEGMPRHTVPANTILAPNQALVVFGGGNPTGDFGGAIVQTANGLDRLLNLNNSADVFVLQNAAGETIFEFDVGDRMMPDATVRSRNPDESYTRSPDITGDFIQHAAAVDNVFFSPGTRIDGSPF